MLQLILTMIPVSDNGFRSAFICIISPPENIILPILYELPPVCCSHFTSSTVIPTPAQWEPAPLERCRPSSEAGTSNSPFMRRGF